MIFPLILLLVSLVVPLQSEEPAKLPKVSSSRLTHDENGLAYLNIKTKRKTGEGYEDNVRRVLFTGIAFTEGENWRAEVTYRNGILDGEVVVVVNNKILSRFQYLKGVRVLGKAGLNERDRDTSP